MVLSVRYQVFKYQEYAPRVLLLLIACYLILGLCYLLLRDAKRRGHSSSSTFQ
jgi:hypothetical protein